MMRFTVLLFCCLLFGIAQGQKAVYHQVTKSMADGRSFQPTSLFKFESTDVLNRSLQLEGLKKGTVLTIDQEAIQNLANGRNDFITLSLPVTDRSDVKLTLIRHNIFAEDFALYTSQSRNPVDYDLGIHYKGIVEGDPSSVVSLSVFNDEIMGMVTSATGNLVLGRIQTDRENRHVLYNDKDLEKSFDFECGTADDGLPYTEEQLKPAPEGRDAGDCVRVYIEIDDDIVTQKGGATPATNYITGLFNQSFVLYTNENVNFTISEILAWTSNSPYSGSTSSAMLNSFVANSGSFNGNIGHLVSYQASGGIAYLNTLCNSNPDYRKCFSSISSSYQNVPTYSWSVMVVTHEMGHVVGSKHTHACAWNGNGTAIDGCAGSVEGSCALPPLPPPGSGTIMSYCHLNVGINLSNGFGTQPGNVIRNSVNASNNCLTSCGPPPPPPPPSYCTSNGTNSSYEWINKVQLGTINNTSGNNNGYGNYTNLSTNLTAGTTYTITLTPGFASNAFNEFWKVWIDYNGDLDWSDAGEAVAQGSGTSVVNVSFTVPAGTTPVTTRMRVSMQYNAYPPNCGSFTYGEVEDYKVVIVAGSGGGTCSDGIQNQGETGIDCGGPCLPCGTCNDGIQNQGETGIDCGGPCAPCPPPPPPGDGSSQLLASYFETGWDGWLDGGTDCARVITANAYEGQYCIMVADNTGNQSAMTSPSFNMTGAIGAQIKFHFYAFSMEIGEDFWVRYNNGSGWVTVATYTRGTNFNNNTFYETTVTIPNFIPTANGTFQIRCDAGDNNDQVFIDAVILTKLTLPALVEDWVVIKEIPAPVVEYPVSDIPGEEEIAKELTVYPNPVQDFLNLNFDGDVESVRIIGIDGQELKITAANHNNKLIDISYLVPGIYFIWVESEGKWYPSRFSKI